MILACLLAVLSGLLYLNFSHRVYCNLFTHSLPYGFYIQINGVPQRGDYAATCLTREIAQYGIARGYLAQGNCETGTVRVLKIIKGVPGDRYALNNGALELNRHAYRIKDKDTLARPLRVFYQQSQGRVERGYYFLLSDFVDNSWDSRYWGPVRVQFLLKPLWVFEKYPIQ